MGAKGIVFDFDGVLVLSEPLHMEAWIQLEREMNKPLPEGFLEEGLGHPDRKMAIELSRKWAGNPGAEIILMEKQRIFRKMAARTCPLVPGIHEALAILVEVAPLAIATCSMRRDIEPIMESRGLNKYFKAIVTLDDVSQPKPHPEVYLKAAGDLDIEPEDCYAFEDSRSGAEAARSAGLEVIALSTTTRPKLLEPYKALIKDFGDIKSILKLVG